MNEEREVKIEPSWKAMLRAEFGEEYFKQLRQFVKGEYQNAIVYPAPQGYLSPIRTHTVRQSRSRHRIRPSLALLGKQRLLRLETFQ